MKPRTPEIIANFVALFERTSARSSNPEYYKWKLFDNPFQQGHAYIEQQNQHIKGLTTLTPKYVASFGRSYMAAEIGDSHTHLKYRRQGIFTRSLVHCIKHAISTHIDIIYGITNERTLPGERKAGFQVCSNTYIKTMNKAINVLPVEQAFDRRIGNYMISKIFARIYIYLRSYRWRFKRRVQTYPIKSIDQFDQQSDGFWGVKRDDYVFFTIRDNTFLNWRFINNPDQYTILAALNEDQYLGYIVMKRWERKGLVYGAICDFITYKDRMDIFHDLITEAEASLKAEGVHIIQLCCAEKTPYFKVLSRAGYKVTGEFPIIVFPETQVGKQLVETKGKWFFTYADTDYN